MADAGAADASDCGNGAVRPGLAAEPDELCADGSSVPCAPGQSIGSEALLPAGFLSVPLEIVRGVPGCTTWVP